MPLYDYECEAGHRYEKRESFGAPAQQPCDQCGKPARRLLHAPPIVFKGSGWYVTDSQRSIRSGVGTVRDGEGGDSDSGSSDSSGDSASSDSGSPSSNGSKPKARAPKAKAKPAADD